VDLGQSRAGSFVESCANVAIGYCVALAAQLIVFPIFSIHIPMSSNLAIGAIITAVSIARSYVVRRVFNKLQRSGAWSSTNA
jgi:hypothetical protein